MTLATKPTPPEQESPTVPTAAPAEQRQPRNVEAASRQNQLLGASLAGVAVLILVVVVTLILLIRYEHLPSLLSIFK